MQNRLMDTVHWFQGVTPLLPQSSSSAYVSSLFGERHTNDLPAVPAPPNKAAQARVGRQCFREPWLLPWPWLLVLLWELLVTPLFLQRVSSSQQRTQQWSCVDVGIHRVVWGTFRNP